MFSSLKIFVDQTIDLDGLLKNLVSLGFQRTKSALQEGDFSQRGGIIDIFHINFDCPIRIELEDDKIRRILSINLKTGESIWQHNIVILLPKSAKRNSPFSADIPLNHFVDIQTSDYVVHHHHGIGRYLGIKQIDPGQKPSHMVIEYKDGDKLFVPRHDLHLVQKYVGFTKRPPKIYRLGSKEWKRVRTLIQKKLQHFAAELLHIQALRSSHRGFRFSADNPWQKEFE